MSVGIVGTTPQIWSGASAPMPPQQKMSNLFNQIDSNGDGNITQQELTQAFQNLKMPPAFKKMGADALFSKLDPNHTGSVSKQSFMTAMQNLMKQIRGHHSHGEQASLGTDTSSSVEPDTSSSDLGNNVDVYA